jgi:hypothetical protein
MECRDFMRGNGYCNDACNTAWCGYDDGDCEMTTHTPSEYFTDGASTFSANLRALLLMNSLN